MTSFTLQCQRPSDNIARRLSVAGLALLALAMPVSVQAESGLFHDYDGSYEDATFAVESAIVNAGLVIDYVSHVGDMLARTGEDVGSDQKLFDGAQIYLFCSAVVSRQVMEADPANVQYCPYSVVVTDRDGQVQIGHRQYPEASMQPVNDLLEQIVTSAME